MKRLTIMAVVAGVVVILGRNVLTPHSSWGFDLGKLRRRMMERMMRSMPEDSPPKLIMSVLPRLREQNDQILALLKEQNDLLRQLSKSR